MSAENNRHEEEIPVIRPGARRGDEPTEQEGPAPVDPGAEGGEGTPDAAEAPANPESGPEPTAEPDKDTKIAELRDANLRVRADFENFRRRAAKQRLEVADQAKAEMARKLLPTLDNLERALEQAEEQGAEGTWVDGLRMVHTQFMSALKDEGIEPIECLGAEFDPECHEVVATMPNEVVPQGFITAEVSRGYRMGDTVIRAAQVVTSSGEPGGDEGDADTGEDTKA
jgi:molecular chaperone GrpE